MVRAMKVFKRCGMGMCANRVKRTEVKWVKRNTLGWSGHIERMKGEDFVKKVYVYK